jgi:hypothetical protein
MSDDTLVALIETVRDELKGEITILRGDIATLSHRIDALASKPVLPKWVATIAIATATAIASSWAVATASHVAYLPSPAPITTAH